MLDRNPGCCKFVHGRLFLQMLKVVPLGTVLAMVLMLPRHPVTVVGWLVYLVVLAGLIGIGWLYYTIEMWARGQTPSPLLWKNLRIPAFLLLAALPLALFDFAIECGFFVRNFL
jgi:hypothetical protein